MRFVASLCLEMLEGSLSLTILGPLWLRCSVYPEIPEQDCEPLPGGKLINGIVCSAKSIVIETKSGCVSGFPHYHSEGMVCANHMTSTEAYCSYDVGPGACARCKLGRRSGVKGTYSVGEDELAAEDFGGGAQGELMTFHERMLNKVVGDKLGLYLPRDAQGPGTKPTRRLLAAGLRIEY